MQAQEWCENCDKAIHVMSQKGTGFCTPRCEEEFASDGE